MLPSEAEDLTKPTVCTIGWEPNVEPHVMIKLLEAGLNLTYQAISCRESCH